jgi:tRNA-specific 2-thiouridylase
MSKKRVLLGMSGGVDSSVAGHLLLLQGYDVIGVTMKVWSQDCISRAEDRCCDPPAIADARGVAHSLGVPHYVVDESDDFERMVINYFTSEYKAGRTPNPCVMCNELLKFGKLWDKAHDLGADFIATGHYAINEHLPTGPVLRKGRDPRKDQSYFLFRLSREQLQRALFPLGFMSKTEIRDIARDLGLPVADKVDSQEICFVPGNDYKAFLKSHLEDGEFHRGGIYDTSGKRLGDHDGIELFTIGQRKGLPGGSPKPLYVIDINPETNSVIVGDDEQLLTAEFEAANLNWLRNEPLTGPVEADIKIRYNHPGARAVIAPVGDNQVRIRFQEPQRAVTPGQAAVFYDDDRVLGGGWIIRNAKTVALTASAG